MGGLRYTDERGVEHLVDDLSEVPPAFQKSARPVRGEVQVQNPSLGTQLYEGARAAVQGGSGEWLGPAHLPSALGGAALTVVVLGLWWMKSRGGGKVMRGLVGLAAAAALYFGYVAWARRQAGLPEAPPTPAAAVDDARRAAGALEEKLRREAEALEAIESEPDKRRGP